MDAETERIYREKLRELNIPGSDEEEEEEGSRPLSALPARPSRVDRGVGTRKSRSKSGDKSPLVSPRTSSRSGEARVSPRQSKANRLTLSDANMTALQINEPKQDQSGGLHLSFAEDSADVDSAIVNEFFKTTI